MSFSRRPRYQPVKREWVADRIQTRLGDNLMDLDVLMDYVEETEICICNYINRNYVPEPLRFVFLNLVMDLLKSQALNGNIDNDKLSELSIGNLSKIEDGDTQIQFKTGGSSSNTGAHVGDVESLLYNYTQQLDKYRLFKW